MVPREIQHPSLPCPPAEVDLFLSDPPVAVIAAVRRMPGDFMVLGAGGKMGLHLCLMLRRALDSSRDTRRVLAVSRFGQPGARREFESRGIVTVPCDLCDPAQLAALDDVPNIIFMAGAKFGTADRPEFLKQMNEEMPRMVAARFASSAITAFSTGCVYSFQPADSPGSTEQAETHPVGDYAKSCLGRELAFRRGAEENGTRLALIRLNYSVEFRYGVPVDLARKILAGQPIDLSMGYVNLIWQRDAVAHAVLAHEHASPDCFVINVTGPGTLRVRDIATTLGRHLGREPILTGTEQPTAWLNDASLSHRLFGPPEMPLASMLEWIAAWQAASLPSLDKATGFERRDGNF